MENGLGLIKKLSEGMWLRCDFLYQKAHCLTDDHTLFYCGRSIPPDDWKPGEWRFDIDIRVTYRCGECKTRRNEWLRVPPPKKPVPMSHLETQRLEIYRRMLRATEVSLDDEPTL